MSTTYNCSNAHVFLLEQLYHIVWMSLTRGRSEQISITTEAHGHTIIIVWFWVFVSTAYFKDLEKTTRPPYVGSPTNLLRFETESTTQAPISLTVKFVVLLLKTAKSDRAKIINLYVHCLFLCRDLISHCCCFFSLNHFTSVWNIGQLHKPASLSEEFWL